MLTITLDIEDKQYYMSPRATDIDPGAFADQPNRSYNCRHRVSNGSHSTQIVLLKPFSTSPFSSMTSVPWNPFPGTSRATGPGAGPFTIRVLIASDDDLDHHREQDFDGLGDNDTFVTSRGTKPPRSLLDPLFLPVTDGDSATQPSDVGMSKEELFGQEGYDLKRLQCGIPR